MLQTGDAILQLALSLVFVVTLIFVFAWLSKRYKLVGSNRENAIRVLSVLHLGRKEKVVMIEADSKRILIGVASNQINILHIFPGDSMGSVDARSEEDTSFASSLTALLRLNTKSDT